VSDEVDYKRMMDMGNGTDTTKSPRAGGRLRGR
jgi:hypothetical protein